ncbi:sensor domain-containing diguanylate cyclase [Cohnella sp. GbtcB17]|uniref:sensor domain-containing diguanylate cyclase n=1 Tax=Cohnella sp. GbtcB17 TaxID=2824762 RepID=UPI001C311121|nr:sensor domain-containing diguanylate cyclase [Cohnella sp. GbtcB17]
MDAQLNDAPCGYFSITAEGLLLRSVNRTMLHMLGYDSLELANRHVESILSVANRLFFHTYFYPYIQLYGHVKEMYLALRTKDGRDLPVLMNGVRQERGGELFIDCVALEMNKRIEHEKDILRTKTQLEALYQATHEANMRLEQLHAEYEAKQQELLRLNAQWEALATTDPLTGLRNRRFFKDSLAALLEDNARTGQPFSLLILDIDHFKRINDTYGHPVGDLVLASLAALLRTASGSADIAARFGGEEFVVLMPGADRASALEAAERYRAGVEAASWEGLRITISVGAATVSPSDTDESLVNRADQALYASKAGGRNRVTHAEAEL